jgi:2-phosphoglycolate phosphatase/molybdopterin-guanine dinucleotide biosynthesis protein MobB
MLPISFVGYSGSGKTTLLQALVKISAARGEAVAVLKHTHHPANGERRGDTGRFLDAGAAETILASEEGLAAHSDGTMFAWSDPRELLTRFTARRIYVEGFRSSGFWPSILVARSAIGRPRLEPPQLVATVSDQPSSSEGPHFAPDDVPGISEFVDDFLQRRSPRFEAVVFDLDGTLIDSNAAIGTAINFARNAHDLPPLEAEAIRAAVGEGVERLLERTFPPQYPASVREIFERHYDEICCDQTTVLENVADTLAAVKGMGLRMAVCTNKPTRFSEKILRHAGLARWFAATVGPDLAGARKPDGRHLLATLERIGREPGESLYVGDMPIDVETARSAGTAIAAVTTGISSVPDLERAGPDHLLHSFSDLKALIASAGDGR